MPDSAYPYDINKSYTWAIQTCNAPNVQYNNSYRNQITVGGITYYDCSSFIWYALKAGGFPLGNGWPFVTANMLPVMQNLGWRQVPITGKWLAGDIVHRYAGQLAAHNNGHVEMVYHSGDVNGTGITMGAHADWFYLPDGSIYYVPPADQVSIINYVAGTDRYTSLWRYGSGADDSGAGFTGSTQYTVAAICAVWSLLTSINPGFHDYSNYVFVGHDCFGMFCLGDSRYTDYRDYCLQNNKNVFDASTQMEYFAYEDYWNTTLSSYTSLSDFLNSTSTDFAELISEFLAGWYDVSVSTVDMTVLISYAQQIKDYISENANDTNISFWYSAPLDERLPATERLNNAVMVYRALSAGGGGGGDPTVPVRRRMKVYRYIRYHNIGLLGKE